MKNLLYSTILILLIISCKKEEEKSTMVINVNAINPVTNTPFKGVKYQIKEVESTSNGVSGINEDKTIILNGETNANGKVNVEFEIFKNKFDYEIQFDFEHMDVPEGDYELVKGGHFSNLYKNEGNNFDFELVPYCSFTEHVLNLNCYDANDKMRIRFKFLFTGSGNWSFWGTDEINYTHGCADITKNHYEPQDKYIYEVETTKNGIVNSFIDTFVINGIDTFNIHY